MMVWYFATLFLFVAVILLALAVFVLARQVGLLYERIAPVGALVNETGPKIGDTAPGFALENLNGTGLSLTAAQSKSRLLFFLSPTCPICKKLLPVLNSVRHSENDWLQIILASDGDEEKHRRFIASAKLQAFPYVVSADLGVAFRVARLPFAVVIDAQGIIRAKGLVNSREQLESLFNAHELGVQSVQEYLSAS